MNGRRDLYVSADFVTIVLRCRSWVGMEFDQRPRRKRTC